MAVAVVFSSLYQTARVNTHAAGGSAGQMDEMNRERLSILVAEDHLNMRRTICNMLKKMGYRRIAEAEDGKEAWEVMQKERFDLVIADWIMPRMTGIDLLRKARNSQDFRKLPFLIVSGVVDEETVAEAAETEVDGYIIKPFVAKTLEEKMDQILDSQKHPDEVEILIELGSEHMRAGRYEEALREFERALSICLESPRVLCLLGEAHEQMGCPVEAEENYVKAIKVAPLFVKAYQRLADLYERQGMTKKAAELLSQASKISPRNTGRQIRLGRLYLKAGDSNKAREAFSEAMRVSGQNAEIRTEIGEVFLKHEMAGEAAQAFEGALKINPQMVHVYNRLGIAYRKQGKFKEAIEQYKRALRIAPNDENLYYNLGRALLEAAMREDALKAFRDALKINPQFSEAKEILATL